MGPRRRRGVARSRRRAGGRRLDSGNVYVTGYFWNEIIFRNDISTGIGDKTLPNDNNDDYPNSSKQFRRELFVAKLDADGDWQWAAHAGSGLGTILDDDGFLTFVEAEGLSELRGLFGTTSAVVSPDGAHVYVSGRDDDAVVVLNRDPATGALDYLTVVRDGENGFDGLDGAEWLAISPDGAHLYLAGAIDDVVAVFSRDATTGLLTFAGGVPGADPPAPVRVGGLDGASSVAVSADGAGLTTGPYALEFLPPTVVSVGAVADPGDAELSEGERVERPSITQLLVRFIEPMLAAGAGSTASYRLVEAGPDGALDTVDCTAVLDDDVAIAIDQASYDGAATTSTLSSSTREPRRSFWSTSTTSSSN